MKRVTLQDIADRLGLGKATVSLALRNHPRVAQKTRERIQTVAREMGYVPDPALARIAAARWRTSEQGSRISVAYVYQHHPQHRREILPEMRNSAMDTARTLGYHMTPFCLSDYPGAESLGRVLHSRGIEGVVLGQIYDEQFSRSFPWAQFAAVAAHVGYAAMPVHMVMPDYSHAVQRAWRECLQAGHRRIGVALLAEAGAVDIFEKLASSLYCQYQHAKASDVVPISLFNYEDFPALEAWVCEHRPSVVLGFNAAVLDWLAVCRIKVPHDLSFVCLDDYRATRLPDGSRLSGMNQDLVLLGRSAMEQLDILLRANRRGRPDQAFTILVPSVWESGATLAPVGPRDL